MGRVGSTWYTDPISPDMVYAHEVGHVLGQYDEYPTGATDPQGEQPTNGTEPNLMKDDGNKILLPRHYRWALKFLNDNAKGDPYETIRRP